MPDVEPSDHFLVWAGAGKARDVRSADLPNLQKRCANVRLWSGFLRL